MKYELINKNTGEKHLCEKVTIDNHDYYVSDEKVKGGTFESLPINKETIRGQIPSDCYVYDNKDNKIYLIDFESHFAIFGRNFLVIATTNKSIDAPQVIDEVEELAGLYLDELIVEDKKQAANTGMSIGKTPRQNRERVYQVEGFIKGYNKHAQKFSNTDEDLVGFFRWVRKNDWQDYSDIKPGLFVNNYGVQKQEAELIKMWKDQQVKVLYFV